MADYKIIIKHKNHLNHKSINGLLLLKYMMVFLMFVQHSNAQETGSSNTSCENEITCTKCTIKAQCVWFLDQQTCVSNTSLKNSILKVHSEEKCPRFSVSTKRDYNNEFSVLNYTVKISNDSVGFIDFLNKNNFTCNSPTISFNASEINNNEIVCSTQIKESYFKQNRMQSLTALIYVKFNGVILWLDNITDHYVTIYERTCAEDDKNKFCATCAWYDNGDANYVRLCFSGNTCEGPNELFMRHNGTGQFWNLTSVKVKDRCAEINVTSVNPLSGSIAADTKVTITVKNHNIFAVGRTVNVTVAGMVCKDLRRTGPDTITCITSPPPDDTYEEPPSGPVLISYSTDKSVLNVESSQTFQFNVGTTCGTPRPVLRSKQELYGVEQGGTNVTLKGLRFIKPCVASSARMFVKLPNGTMQFASKNCYTPDNDMNIVCRAPEMNETKGWDVNAPNFTRSLNFGLEVMGFVRNNSLLVNGPLTSYYHILEDYQLKAFEIISGGSVAVYGHNLRHIHPDVLIRFGDLIAKKCKVTLAEEHIFQCTPNTTVVASKVMLVEIAGLLTYSVNKRLCNCRTKLIWFVAIFSMVIVSALACMYLFNRRANVHKTVHDHHPLKLVDLDTQTALLKC